MKKTITSNNLTKPVIMAFGFSACMKGSGRRSKFSIGRLRVVSQSRLRCDAVAWRESDRVAALMV